MIACKRILGNCRITHDILNERKTMLKRSLKSIKMSFYQTVMSLSAFRHKKEHGVCKYNVNFSLLNTNFVMENFNGRKLEIR